MGGPEIKGSVSLFRRPGSPPSCFHAFFDGCPDILDDFTIAPAAGAMDTAFLVPSLDGEALHAAAPAADFTGDVFTAPADVDACGVLEKFGRGGPLVRLELPGLARCENGNETVPVVRTEVGGAVNEDEAGGFLGSCSGRRSAKWARGGRRAGL